MIVIKNHNYLKFMSIYFFKIFDNFSFDFFESLRQIIFSKNEAVDANSAVALRLARQKYNSKQSAIVLWFKLHLSIIGDRKMTSNSSSHITSTDYKEHYYEGSSRSTGDMHWILVKCGEDYEIEFFGKSIGWAHSPTDNDYVSVLVLYKSQEGYYVGEEIEYFMKNGSKKDIKGNVLRSIQDIIEFFGNGPTAMKLYSNSEIDKTNEYIKRFGADIGS